MRKALQQGVSYFRSFKPTRTEDGLDLSYIPFGGEENKIAAMCYPSLGTFGSVDYLLRNDAAQVAAFLDNKHGRNPATGAVRYRVFNLTENPHPPSVAELFHNSVVHYPIPDHNVPQFSQIFDFCENVEHFFQQDPDNAIAVHCKAGKGRTGTMICCYLLYSFACKSPEEALRVFSEHRSEPDYDEQTGKLLQRGVDQASQVRWVYYFAQLRTTMLNEQLSVEQMLQRLDSAVTVISRITIKDPQDENKEKDPPYIVVKRWGYKKSKDLQILRTGFSQFNITIQARAVTYNCDAQIRGETKVEVWDEGLMKDSCMCRYWLHPYFQQGASKLVLFKEKIDDIWNSSKWAHNFSITTHFKDTK
mmetsp:Transcript_8590/g.16431  ORF Transcript_8590/g.16431 Transcript_8590/m.16431 type:complete len:361 (+) Transcript_8590:27-1109(+)